jgi:hypothetical protein
MYSTVFPVVYYVASYVVYYVVYAVRKHGTPYVIILQHSQQYITSEDPITFPTVYHFRRSNNFPAVYHFRRPNNVTNSISLQKTQ